ncbi:MAG: hypothetical protein QOJ94_568 [Sphingomonadales bacterium]|jgi:hypothetical protein|nr:hypothetical protein [Sphingomonadales bacterium]
MRTLTLAAMSAALLALAGCEQVARDSERQAEQAAAARAQAGRAEAEARAEAERRRDKRNEVLTEKAVEWPERMAEADSEANNADGD